MHPCKRFGANVRKIRQKRGWSQEKLAEVSGLHRTYVSGIERGIRNPTLTIISQIADALRVPTSSLV
ncbi:MAG: helix-turn-helix transcriptional regulator [Acidobacteriota bacterium]|nr:helix-turn-helix transcriptional regulator [Acidobacteriota bacterium]